MVVRAGSRQQRAVTVQKVDGRTLRADEERGPKRSVRFDGSLLRRTREDCDYTQQQLAQIAAVDTATVRRAERGTPVSWKVARDISAALGLAFEDLELSSETMATDHPQPRHISALEPRAVLDITALLADQAALLAEIRAESRLSRTEDLELRGELEAERRRNQPRLTKLLIDAESSEHRDRLHALEEIEALASYVWHSRDNRPGQAFRLVDDEEGDQRRLEAASLQLASKNAEIVAVMAGILNHGISINLSDSDDANVLCLRAINILGYLETVTSSAVTLLARYLHQESAPSLHWVAAHNLARMGTPEAVKILMDNAYNDRSGVSLSAIISITSFSADLVPLLIEALDSPLLLLRSAAAFKLGQFGRVAKGAVPALTAKLNESDDDVAREATRALGLIQSSSYQREDKE